MLLRIVRNYKSMDACLNHMGAWTDGVEPPSVCSGLRRAHEICLQQHYTNSTGARIYMVRTLCLRLNTNTKMWFSVWWFLEKQESALFNVIQSKTKIYHFLQTKG